MSDIYEKKQEMFAIAYLGMASQKFEQSLGLNEYGHKACRYRGNENRRCIVGYLIPDELYRPDMEGYVVGQLYQNFTGLPYENPELVSMQAELQAIHDRRDYSPEQRRKRLIEWAQQYQLKIPNEE